jgi:general secretion pathway protein J
MMVRRYRASAACRGFSLIETLAALALMGVILSALARLTSQWMPGWDRGFERIQRSEGIGIALQRISEDLGASEFMRASRDTKFVLFEGSEDAVTFARTALGPNVAPGLEVVRIAEAKGSQGFVLIRSHARFVPGATEGLVFSDPVVLLRAPYRVSFSYADRDRAWKTVWREADALPQAVLVTLRDAATERPIGVSRIAAIHVGASAEMTCAKAEHGCGDAKEPAAQNAGTSTGRSDR